MQGMFLVFNFLKHFLCYHITPGYCNDQGQIYVMRDCVTGLDTVTLNNAFEHANILR